MDLTPAGLGGGGSPWTRRAVPSNFRCEQGSRTRDTYTIDESDPLSARTRSTTSIRLHRPEPPWDARVETRSELSRDVREFATSNELIRKDGNEVVFHRTWERRIPRAEAVARGNRAYAGQEFEPRPDPMCHEFPEYCAYGLYFKPNTGRLPDVDLDTDLSAWEVRPAPPAGSPAWTLEA